MSVVLSEHVPLLASAPDGIQKLRGLILELAVRGKLMPQDPKDEPASELLKRIAQERVRMEADGILKKSKPMPPVEEDEQPFKLPNGWSWGRIADVANSQAGFAFKSSAFNDAGIGLPLIRIRDVGFSNPTTFFDGPYRDDFVVTEGDYLISMDGQFRVAVWKGPDALLNQRVSRLQFFGRELARAFFAISLHIRLAELQGVKAYTTVDHLSGGQISAAVVGVPPLAEQHRIVAKVDELMALCDRLEAEQTDAETAHAKLVETLLGTLTQSANPAELAANWQRLAEHFDSLFTTESSLDALKQTILQLAVMGKLVPQDPNDEPAGELLMRIAKERARLEAEGVCKKSKAMPPVGEDERPFEVPEGWMWTRWGNVTHWMTYGFTRPMPHVQAGPPIITAKNVTYGAIDFSNVHFTTHEAFEALSLKDLPSEGDLLITKDGSIGRAAVVPPLTAPFCINQSVAVLWLRELPINRQFLVNVIHSPLLQRWIWDAAAGAAIKHISITDFVLFGLPLPPLAEQHRIVAKVDELMALCDRLKADLAESRTRQARLSATLIESALQAA